MSTMRKSFARTIPETLEDLKVNPLTGLSDIEAEDRLKDAGPNRLREKKRKTIFQLFIAQLQDILIYVLFGAVALTLFMGEYIDATIILLVIVINAILGVVQEVKAGNAIAALKKLSAPKALVKRNSETKEIDSDKIVPGDIVILDAGRFVPADLRLVESANLQIEESALTGESVPANKNASAIFSDPETPPGDRANSAYMSTIVTYGRGVGVVTATGMQTEVGKIAGIIEDEADSETPLEKRLDELGKTLGKVAIAICAGMFLLAFLQGRDLAEMFLTAVSLAVASIPEGLAAIVAVVLSIGVTSMARRNVIIRKLPAVETLGSVNIVCSDKTGTLTQNKMTVTKYFTLAEGEATVEGNQRGIANQNTVSLAEAMILCSDATYENGTGTGDPTEIALLIFGDTIGIDRGALRQRSTRVAELAFESDRKLMSTLHDDHGKLTVFTKGAIDSLIPRCSRALVNGTIAPLSDEHRTEITAAAESMSSRALRTLAAAYKPVASMIRPDEMEQDLVFIGIVGMIDPPRIEVRDFISKAKNAGITTVMITGDHKHTAFAIARELGIADHIGQTMTGGEISKHSEESFLKNISDYRVFARVMPEHKVRIVRAYKSQGNVVAMTGDGVNDAPSLGAADIGVAMGITGTDVARNASDMILADDNFATIIAAIEQGRNIYNNIKKSIVFLLASNLGEVVAVVLSILIGLPPPLIATQLLWINLLTDTLPAVALGMDPGDPDVMNEKPRSPEQSFFAEGSGARILIGGSLIGILTIFAFWYGYHSQGYDPYSNGVPQEVREYAGTMAFMTIISCQLFYALTFRHPVKSIFQVGIFSNRYLVGALVMGLLLQLLVMGIPALHHAFRLQMLDVDGWVNVIGLGFIPLLVNEIWKIFLRRKRRSFND